MESNNTASDDDYDKDFYNSSLRILQRQNLLDEMNKVKDIIDEKTHRRLICLKLFDVLDYTIDNSSNVPVIDKFYYFQELAPLDTPEQISHCFINIINGNDDVSISYTLEEFIKFVIKIKEHVLCNTDTVCHNLNRYDIIKRITLEQEAEEKKKLDAKYNAIRTIIENDKTKIDPILHRKLIFFQSQDALRYHIDENNELVISVHDMSPSNLKRILDFLYNKEGIIPISYRFVQYEKPIHTLITPVTVNRVVPKLEMSEDDKKNWIHHMEYLTDPNYDSDDDNATIEKKKMLVEDMKKYM